MHPRPLLNLIGMLYNLTVKNAICYDLGMIRFYNIKELYFLSLSFLKESNPKPFEIWKFRVLWKLQRVQKHW